MSAVVLAAPYTPPAPGPDPWNGVKFVWTGWDGSEWDLDDTHGVYLRRGVRGLTMPRFDRYTSTAAGVPGSRHRGHRAQEREVFWPISVWQDTDSIGWLEYDAAFWATMRPDAPGQWTVVRPDGASRSIMLRFVDDMDVSWDHSPGLRGWAQYGITLVAEDPFWVGSPVFSPVWGQSADAGAFIGEEGAPPFYLSSGSTISSAQVTNPGDVEAWPTWTITGPTLVPAGDGPSVELGVNGRTVGVPFEVPAGQTLTIDTDPRKQTARMGGFEMTGLLDPHEFAPIPPGAAADLTLRMEGTGTVQARFLPRYYRAW